MTLSSRLQSFMRALALVAVCVVSLEALYLVAGHRIVEAAFASHQRTFLNNLISGPGSHPPAEYLAAADAWYAQVRIWVVCIGAILAIGTLADPIMGGIHQALVTTARRAAEHPTRFIVAMSLGSLLLVTVVGRCVLEDFPNSGDEYCYLYQAQTFAAGRLGNPPHPLQEFFELLHVGQRGGLLVTSFPPGWPLLLAAAMVARVPIWIVNPLVGAASLVVLFVLARRICSDEVAVMTVISVLSSSFFIFTSASYFAHAFAVLLLLLFTYFAFKASEDDSAIAGAVAGACLGWAVITRYYPALLCAAPIALFALQTRPRPYRAIIGCVAGGVPFLAFLLFYNTALTGHALMLTRSGMEAEGRWFPANFVNRGIEFGLSRLGRLLLWTPPALLFAYIAVIRGGLRDQRQRALALIFIVLAIGLVPFIDSGGNQYGPRYYYEGFPFLALAAVGGLFTGSYGEKSASDRRLFYLFVLSLALTVPTFACHARTERRIVRERTDLYRQVEERRLRDAIVFIQTRVGAERSMNPLDLTRNGIDISGNVLYAIDHGDENRRLMAYYPDRSYFTYRYELGRRAGILTQIGGPRR